MTDPDGATPLEPEERQGLRFGHVETRGELDRLEQANVQEGMRWLARQRDPDVLVEPFVRELHRRLFGEVWRWAGTLLVHELGARPIPWGGDGPQTHDGHRKAYVAALRAADAGDMRPLLDLFGDQVG